MTSAREDAARAMAIETYRQISTVPLTDDEVWQRLGDYGRDSVLRKTDAALSAALVITPEDVEAAGLQIETMERLRRAPEDRPSSDYRILARAALQAVFDRKLGKS